MITHVEIHNFTVNYPGLNLCRPNWIHSMGITANTPEFLLDRSGVACGYHRTKHAMSLKRLKTDPSRRRMWRAPPPLKITDKGVSDGFFLKSNIHEIHFPAGLRPGPRTPVEKLTALPDPYSDGEGTHFLVFPSSRRLRRLDLGDCGMKL